MAQTTSPAQDFSPSATGASATSRETLRFLALTSAVLFIGMLGAYALGLHGSLPFPQDGNGNILGHDFLNTWFFGKAAFLDDPGRFYDHDAYAGWVSEVVPNNIVERLWSYPPHFLLMAAPLGYLPYPLALAVWTLTGLAALYGAIRGDRLSTFTILTSPAALFCIISGQISFFLAAFMLAALRHLDRRPLIAGFLISLCTVKPQTGLLIPVLLVASGRWRVLCAAALGTCGLAAASLLIWGVDIWRDYIGLGLPAQLADTAGTYQVLTPWSPTITTALIMAGLDAKAAAILQLGFAALAALLVAIGCRRGPMDARKTALFLACSVFAAPYLLAHDLVAVTAAAVMLAVAEPLDKWGSLAVKAIFLLPMLQMAAGVAHIPGVAIVPVGFALWAFLRRDPAPPNPCPSAVPIAP
ncbi:glycosyltransferase family 87 protein [Methyloferula stellata]|uniref:glycosyltransferase family 87 protein n=1 Tax=Methyloferula stellata TaxID=876270 RepID=UPI00037677DF|nr:glycosyltransferase family 87 protein [Methyloferula stellata]